MSEEPTERQRPQESARRQARAERILDTAAALILRWGYNKTTIDDVARQAGVAKGTIYLHWNTREELFAALMKRERAALSEDVRRRIAADPAGTTLHGLMKHSALGLMQRPLLKAVLLRDIEVIGKLAHSQHSSEAYVERLAGFKTYLELLREHGLVRADREIPTQVYMISAIFMGYFLVGPLMPDEYALGDEALADLIAETTRRTLELEHPSGDTAGSAAGQVMQHYLNRGAAIADEQFQQALDPGRLPRQEHDHE